MLVASAALLFISSSLNGAAFLLALAALPGALLPQRSLSQTNVRRYFADHPALAPVLDRLYLFDVFSAPWVAAVYLLLFISLIGCVLPRALEHYRSLD